MKTTSKRSNGVKMILPLLESLSLHFLLCVPRRVLGCTKTKNTLRNRRARRPAARLLAIALFVSVHAGAQEQHARPLITEEIDETKLVTLKGNTSPKARAEYDRGP